MKNALVLLALASLSVGCAGMGTKRPSGGQQITKTATEETVPTAHGDAVFEQRADLGQR
jgi:hypothetical protein